MTANTFNADALNTLQVAIDAAEIDGVMVKRSFEYKKAAAIGRPGKPRTLLVSQLDDETDKHGQWFVTAFPLHHPKEVADGEIPLASGYGYHFETWKEVVALAIGFYL